MVELQKNGGKILNYKGKLWTLSHNFERLNEIAQLTKVLKVLTFIPADMICATLFLNRDAYLVISKSVSVTSHSYMILGNKV